MGVYWHRSFRPKRFSQAAYSEYGARTRSRPYDKRKLIEKGHNRPLDYSGQARQETQQQVIRAIIQRQGGLVVTIRGSRKFNFRPKTKGKRKAIDLRKEWHAWSPRERVKLQKVMRQRTVYHLRRLGSRQAVTVRINAA